MMCIAKAKLCTCITHVLSGCFHLVKNQKTIQGQGDDTWAGFMLFPEKMDQFDKIHFCDVKLKEWVQDLPPRFTYTQADGEEVATSRASFVVHRAVLHMVYFATVSSLHRLLVLPSAGTIALQKYEYYHNLQAISYNSTRTVSLEISRICLNLQSLKLEQFLPSYTLTAVLPAVMILLLDLKSFNKATREEALQGFHYCTQVLETLRGCSWTVDYASQFLGVAIKTVGADIRFTSDSPNERAASPDDIETCSENIACLIYTSKAAAQLAQTETPSVHTALINNDSSGVDGAESTSTQSFEYFDGTMSFEGTKLNDSFNSLIDTCGAVDSVDRQYWDSTLEGVMNGESGCLFMDLDQM